VSDSDFAGLVRRNRERLGLTTSRVAELIGRSPGTVRAWEKGTTRPTEDSVVSSLAAVLGIDESVLFDAAGLEPPVVEASPSMRQALSTLAPRPETVEPKTTRPSARDQSSVPGSAPAEAEGAPPTPEREPDRSTATFQETDDEEFDLAEPATSPASHVRSRAGRSSFADRLRAATVRRAPRPAAAPSTLPPVPTAPSYMEDANERWSYRLRAIYTAVGVILMFIVLGWAASNLFDSLGELWSELTANL
jgi:transcriptional regulator with XRE-family HTH domain